MSTEQTQPEQQASINAENIDKTTSTPPIIELKPMVEATLNSFKEMAQIPVKMAPMEEADESLPFEKRIEAFLSKRKGQTLRINEFLKSLYGVSKIPGLKPDWHHGHEGKRLARIIGKLVDDRIIHPTNDSYKELGTFYYDGEDPRTKYHNLNTINVEVKVL